MQMKYVFFNHVTDKVYYLLKPRISIKKNNKYLSENI